MKRLICIVFYFSLITFSQNIEYIPGEITYKSSQHVYVKFQNIDNLVVGDSVYIKTGNDYIFEGVVRFLSSTSAAVETASDLKIGMILYRKLVRHRVQESKEDVTPVDPDITESASEVEIKETGTELPEKVSKFYGSVSVTSYSNLTNRERSINTQRWKYLSSLNYDYIGSSNFSFTSYITFSYRTHQWNIVENNLMNALRIYNFAFKYGFDENTDLWFGRRINSNLANISTIDGVQFESSFGSFNYGVVAGSRPNFSDFGFNIKLFQYGGYIARTDTIDNKTIKNSLAVFQQTNNFKTDRRFFYFQHSNNVIENVSLFLSAEIDLYKRDKGVGKSVLNLTSFYFLTRYSPSSFISLTASYDARKNVFYYETYKSIADSILESETRQGLRFRVTLRPLRYLMMNLGAGYRFKPGDPKPTRNYNGSITYSRVPFINSSVSISGNLLQTNYLDGRILGLRLYKDLFNGLLNLGLGFRNLAYEFSSRVNELKQNIIETNLSFRFDKNVYFNISYEGVFEVRNSYGRVFINLTKRFR